jgi:hypothetical protein
MYRVTCLNLAGLVLLLPAGCAAVSGPSLPPADLPETSHRVSLKPELAAQPEDVGGAEGPVPDEVTPGAAALDAGALPGAPPGDPGDSRDRAWASAPPLWGVVGGRGFALGDHVASNGQEFKQLFSLDLDLNVWLWRREGLYLFFDGRFWGQKAAPGITNPSQGPFDFSKREFDFSLGPAWNYYGNWEARAFGYSFNNLNRGTSQVAPTGFNDGVGLENRYYLGPVYAALGTPSFDQARASFVSLGYYPTKDMVDGDGVQFKPGPFARAYLTCDLFGDIVYAYADGQLVAERSCLLKLLTVDVGVAVRPFARVPRLEIRLGTEDAFDLQNREAETGLYGSLRYVY